MKDPEWYRLEQIFPGQSTMAQTMRDKDWKLTSLGPPQLWPENLRAALNICLLSRFPMHVWWGPELTFFYNDDYIDFLGPSKHPHSLGKSGREIFSDLWQMILPLISEATEQKNASWSEDILMFCDRHLSQEEIYMTFSFSPILGTKGQVDGLFCICTETTEKRVVNRRLETLNELGQLELKVKSVQDIFREIELVLEKNSSDIPFAVIYMIEKAAEKIQYLSRKTAVLPSPVSVFPKQAILGPDLSTLPWPMSQVIQTQTPQVIEDLSLCGLQIDENLEGERIKQAVIMPITNASKDLIGILIGGIAPRRVFNEQYLSFYRLITGHVGAALSNAYAAEIELKRKAVMAIVNKTSRRPPITASKFSTEDFSHARILVVDARTPMRNYLTHVIARRWSVQAARNAQIALEILRKENFDLVLFDVMLPELDGRNFFQILRMDPHLQRIPVIIISSRAGEEESRHHGLEVGADDFLVHPFSPQEVMARIETQLRLQSRSRLESDNSNLMQLHEFSIGLISEEELPSLLHTVLSAAVSFAQTNMGMILLYHQESQKLQSVEHQGIPLKYVEQFCNQQNTAPIRTVCSEACRLGKRVIVSDIEKDTFELDALYLNILRQAGIRAVQATPLVSRDGKLLGTFSTHWSMVHTPSESVLKILDILAREAADLIEFHKRQDKLFRAKENAEKESLAKDIFLANLSHELRTPLAAILGWTQLILTGRLAPSKIQTGLLAIEENAKIQSQLINDLLDVSKIILEKLSLEKVELNLVTEINKAICSIGPLAEKKCIQISFDYQNLPMAYKTMADSARLQQIFWNILNNALKFTNEKGKIEIKLRSKSEELAEITIHDTGIGINPQFLPHIFDRFSQDEPPRFQHQKGLGLGLSLVRTLMNLHAGTVVATSPGEGLGSTFTLTLPLVNPEKKKHEIIMNSPIPQSPGLVLQGIHILLVDDERINREVINEALSSFGAQVQLASSSQEALLLFEARRPDVIISDIMMPDENGLELIRKIRKKEEFNHSFTPALALTAYVGHENKKTSEDAGFNSHLEKPINIFTLAEIVLQLSKQAIN